MKKRSLPVLLFLSGVGGLVLGTAFAAAAMGWAQASEPRNTLVTGIGGVFFKARDPEQLRAWYREHLGIDAGAQGVNFFWREADGGARFGRTVWSVFPNDTDYFGASGQSLMINYRVNDLNAVLAKLQKQGVKQVGKLEEYWYGRFAWILDGEGNRVELWEPDHYSPKELERRMNLQEKRK